MNFDELWIDIAEMHILPEMAIAQIPRVLAEDTKEKLENYNSKEVVRIMQDTITEINNGCVETIDSLVRKKLINIEPFYVK